MKALEFAIQMNQVTMISESESDVIPCLSLLSGLSSYLHDYCFYIPFESGNPTLQLEKLRGRLWLPSITISVRVVKTERSHSTPNLI